jgi:hypothetical protein
VAKEGQIMIFAYVGPETLLPMTSLVAGVIGIFLMLGRGSLRYMTGVLQAGRRGGRALRRTASRPESVGSTD